MLQASNTEGVTGLVQASNTEGVTGSVQAFRLRSDELLTPKVLQINSAFVLLSELCSDELLTPKVLQIQVQVKIQTKGLPVVKLGCDVG